MAATRLLLALLGLSILLPSPARAQLGLLFEFEGFAFESQNSSPAEYLAVGESYELLGIVTRAGSWIAPFVDLEGHQYTLTPSTCPASS